MTAKSQNIFEIPVGDLHPNFTTLYYAPMTHRVSFSQLEELPEDNCQPHTLHSVSGLRKMSILPNHRCNFNCSYCYAAQGRNTEQLTLGTLEAALNYFIDKNRIDRPLSVAILGGGEPMLSWTITRYAIEYARKKGASENLHVEITLVTNASIIDDGIIKSLIDNDVIVNASFDLTEDAQNAQRKNFSLVKRNIQAFSDAGVYTTINSTITPLNVCEMVKMVENAHDWFPKVKYMIFEPVVAMDLFETKENLHDFYSMFISNFNRAAELGAELGLGLTCRILKSLDSCTDRGCEGRFNLCPNGDVTICYCTASEKDPNFENRVYGKVNEKGVLFDLVKFAGICRENVYNFEKCVDCFAKFNCAGGCMLPNDRYSEPYLDELCWFNREFLRRELIKRAGK